jgi:glycosyltransferase involved in cell wall biosynthesis
MKKVALIINHLSGGGAERAVSKISVALDGRCELYLILSDGSRIGYPYKGTLVNLKIPHRKNILLKALNALRRIHRLRAAKKRLHLDMAISFHELSNMANLFSRRGEKVFVSVRNVLSERNKQVFYDRLYGRLVRLFYNSADGVIAVSELCGLDLVKNFGIRKDLVTVIPNLYNFAEISALAEAGMDDAPSPKRSACVSTMGRLSDAKGQWHLIRAFSLVHERFPRVSLCILGQGELEGYLRTLARDLGLEKSVVFMGFQENPFRHLAASTLFVFPSLFEGFPNALAEAMACGLPVISCDCPSGPREILAPDTEVTTQAREIEYASYGILVPLCDGKKYPASAPLTAGERLMAGAITDMLLDENMRNRYAELSKIRIRHFDQEIVVKRWIELINR